MAQSGKADPPDDKPEEREDARSKIVPFRRPARDGAAQREAPGQDDDPHPDPGPSAA